MGLNLKSLNLMTKFTLSLIFISCMSILLRQSWGQSTFFNVLIGTRPSFVFPNPLSLDWKLFLNHFLVVLADYWGLLFWDVETTSSFLLLRREVVSQRSLGSGIGAALGVLALVIQHLQPCHLLLRVVTFSAGDQQEELLGRHKFLCLRVRQCCSCMKESPQTSSKVHQRYHCDAAAINSCQMTPVAPGYLLSLIPPLGMLTYTSTATWQGTTALWNSNLSSEPCSWVPDSISSTAADYSIKLADWLQAFPSMQEALSRKIEYLFVIFIWQLNIHSSKIVRLYKGWIPPFFSFNGKI